MWLDRIITNIANILDTKYRELAQSQGYNKHIAIISFAIFCSYVCCHKVLRQRLVGWLVVLRIYVDLAIFQPYFDLEAGENQSLTIRVARPGIEPWSSCSASQELNHSATATPFCVIGQF